MTASLDSGEPEVGIALHLPVSSQKSVNFEPAGYSLKMRPYAISLATTGPTPVFWPAGQSARNQFLFWAGWPVR
jgi:hypothetical protein